ncbi:bactofilin family protein [Paraferrimonas haliotis]|uniref:DUF583 domain-containing protein n=1 Tax=Paraferrimonas haliotis TaxID=2013866 RepID=A0AA37WZE8_9GAMM|nr:polymer-forming cytoskeletal protein [Paraferrimonas haliotis]GLS83841.1 DUF583 domain-containing protein [Paraferrimonas haliotis]GLS83968.1 DUF583 domain-containing protein [Paraferrimonas haliotis]
MFSKKKPGQLTYLAPGCELQGQLHFDGNTLVGGQVSGQVHSQADIEVEKSGELTGQIQCKALKISGKVEGSVHCQQLIIDQTGTLDGEVYCETIEIFQGGQFIGHRLKQQPDWVKSASQDEILELHHEPAEAV